MTIAQGEQSGKALSPGASAAIVKEQPQLLKTEDRLWSDFAGSRSASDFLESWLALQCREVKHAIAGLLLLRENAGRYTPAAVWPDRSRDVTHLADVAKDALTRRSGAVASGKGGRALVAYPIEVFGTLHGVVAIEVGGEREVAVAQVLRRLHWGAGWLETLFRRREAEQDRQRISEMGASLDLLAVAAEHPEQREGATAIATTIATRFNCGRVSLGLVRSGNVTLKAISHQAVFKEQVQIVDAIENAMEETIDQDAALSHPPAPLTARRISVAQAELGRISGAQAVATIPLVSAGQAIGALTLERFQAEVFSDEELSQLSSIAIALGPLVATRARSDRLVAGSLVDSAMKGVKALTGPRRPALKVVVVAVLAVVAWMSLATGDFRLSARTSIESTIQRSAIAPFDGFISKALARAGDTVAAGQVLATLDTRELELEAARWRAERDQQSLKYQQALGKQDRAQARMLAAQIEQAQAQLNLVENKIERATLRSPFRGLVVSGDLSQMLSAPVETGKVLFEIASLDTYRGVLQVDERSFVHVRERQTGELRLSGSVMDTIPIVVTKVTPVASAQEGQNTFRVEAELVGSPDWVRPGMEGVARVSAGERRLIWIWTRSMIDWIRLALWTWWP